MLMRDVYVLMYIMERTSRTNVSYKYYIKILSINNRIQYIIKRIEN